MNNKIWQSIDELAEKIQEGYSVTDPKAIGEQYMATVAQYPFYQKWFDKILEVVRQNNYTSVIEYGPGPGVLAGKLAGSGVVKNYLGVEPGEIFRQMTKQEVGDLGEVVDTLAEDLITDTKFDCAVATAAYHHFENKPEAIKKIFGNLKEGGIAIFAEVFLPDYKFDADFNPTDKKEFSESVLRYCAAQILAMPNPKSADIVDQIKAAWLDTLRIEELKVCVPILLAQLHSAGFKNIEDELMIGDNSNIDYKTLGWHFITAKK